MTLVNNKSYFVSEASVVLREGASGRSKGLNHLILGDWLKYLGEEKSSWAKVRSRGTTGWLPKSTFSEKRLLEVNFIDIGQGDGCHIVTPDDQVMVIDAGIGDNMFRFLNWRYNLRGRKVAGVDGAKEGDAKVKEPFPIDHVMISHPDKDHYYGFKEVFENRKLIIKTVYHNGIVERPITEADKDARLKYYSSEDLGGYAVTEDGEKFLWETVETSTGMHDLIKKHKGTSKQYLSTLEAAVENNKKVKFVALKASDGHLTGFGPDAKVQSGDAVELKLLGPVTEEIELGSESRDCLIKLGAEGVTKNGHSVIVQLRIGKLKVMLGGDLNTESEDYLLQHYAETTTETSKLENRVYEIKAKGTKATEEELQELAEAEAELNAIIAIARKHFQVDVTKACHHGSHHFSETFLQVLNSIVTVISSGDEESYAHPRPDALGSFGKYGRGLRPLIFSTELARNTREFTPIFEYFKQLKAYEALIAAAPTTTKKRRIEKEMQERKDRNVAVYGMITLRTDGEKVILAQKLEVPKGGSKKWDIHELHYNKELREFEYVIGAKGH